MQFSAEDRDLAIRTIIGEEASLAGQAGVAAVILNRLAQGGYGDTLGDVVLSPGQFEPWRRSPGDLLRIRQDDPRYVRAGQVLDGVNSGEIADPTGGATHFYAPRAQAALGRDAPSWASGQGQLLGSTMFYAPQGRVDRKVDPASGMATRLGEVGAERQQDAATGALRAEGVRRQAGAELSAPAGAARGVASDRLPADAKNSTLPPGWKAAGPAASMPPGWKAASAEPPLGDVSEGAASELARSKGDPILNRLPGAIAQTAYDFTLAPFVEGAKLTKDVAEGRTQVDSPEAIAASTGVAQMLLGGEALGGRGAVAPAETAARAAEDAMRGVGRPPEELRPQPVQRDVATRAQPSAPGDVEFVKNSDGSWSMRHPDGTTEAAAPKGWTPAGQATPKAETAPSRIAEKTPEPETKLSEELRPQSAPRDESIHEMADRYAGYSSKERLQILANEMRRRFSLPFHIEIVTVADQKVPSNTLGQARIYRNVKSGKIAKVQIVTRAQYAPKRQAAVFTHEFGHVLENAFFEELPQSEQVVIRQAFERDTGVRLDTDVARKAFVAEQMGAPLNEASQTFTKNLLKKSGPRAKVDWVGNVAYNKQFSEWFANQVSRFLTTNAEAVSVIDKFFKGVADFWRKLYETFTGKQGASAEIESFMRRQGKFFADEEIEMAAAESHLHGDERVAQAATKSNVEPPPQSVGAAAASPPAALPDRPTTATIWEQEDRFNRLRKSVDADRSELMKRVDAMPPEARNPATQQRLYRKMEDPNFPLTPAEQKIFDEHIAPLKREELALWEEAKKTDLDGVSDYDPTYAHRVVKGKNPHFDRVLGASGDSDSMGPIGSGRGLPQKTSSMRERVYFAVQDAATGERRIVARDEDGHLSFLENGQYTPLKSDQKLNVGDAFHYDGKLWTLEQARAHEITAAGGPEYYENAAANTIDNVVRLRQVVRAIHEFERLKASEEWLAYARRIGGNQPIPHDWIEPKMPLFRGWRVHPRLAHVIDDFYGSGGDLFDRLAKINRFAVGTMFWSPVRHIYNVSTHWGTARGWDNVTPQGMASLAADGFRAVQEVIGQGPKYQALLREGNGLVYSSVANHDFYRKMLARLGEDVKRNPSKWDPIARAFGVGPSDLIRMIYQGSSRVLWSVSDMMMMQRVLELERKGMSLRDAIKEAERHIPPYRTYSEILGSRLASEIYFSPALTEFSRYHYGMFNSWANIVKDLTMGGKNPLGQSRRIEATGNLLATAAIMVYVAPIVNAAFQSIFGSNVRVTPAGPMTLAAPVVDKIMQTDWAKKHFPDYIKKYYNGDTSFLLTAQNLFALAPITRAGLEVLADRDFFTGQPIAEPSDIEHGRAGRVAGQVLGHLAEKTIQPYYALNRIRSQGKDVGKGFLEQALGLSEPNRAGLEKVRKHQEHEAQRRAARPRDIIEELFGRLPF